MDKVWTKIFSVFLIIALFANMVLFALGMIPLLWFWLVIGFAFVAVKVLF